MVQVPVPRRFTVTDYYRMAKAGILKECDRVELIEGEVVQMPPIGDRHALSVNEVNYVFTARLLGNATVSVQNPVRLSTYSEPVPDIAIIAGQPRDYAGRHPGPEDVLLIIEVALTTLSYDRRRKLPLYAQVGIPETWIVNLRARRLEIYREPVDGRYTQTTVLGPEEMATPVRLPAVQVNVRDILA